MLHPWTLVGFVGHRHLEDSARVQSAIEAALDRLEENGRRQLAAVSSVAIGADTLFAEAARRRGLPWLAQLPFALERFQQDFSPEDWSVASQLLARAVSIQIEPAAGEHPEPYLECGVRIVDECDVLVAVWNGAPAGGPGGTGDIIAYAYSLGHPVLWIHSRTLAVTASNLDKLPGPVAPTAGEKFGRTEVADEFARLDQAAGQHTPEAEPPALSVILLQLLAVAVVTCTLATGVAGLPAQLATGFEVACLGFSLWLVLRHPRGHPPGMNLRIAAEICRSALATWELPAAGRAFPKVEVRGFEHLQTTLRLNRLRENRRPATLPAVRDRYLAGRVQGQIDFFSRQIARAGPRLRRLRTGAVSCTVGAMVLGSAALWLSLTGAPGTAYPAVKALSLLLPLLNAALLACVVAHDLARRVSRYREMAHLLRLLERRLAHARSWGGLERLVTEVEGVLMQEVLQWHSGSRGETESCWRLAGQTI